MEACGCDATPDTVAATILPPWLPTMPAHMRGNCARTFSSSRVCLCTPRATGWDPKLGRHGCTWTCSQLWLLCTVTAMSNKLLGTLLCSSFLVFSHGWMDHALSMGHRKWHKRPPLQPMGSTPRGPSYQVMSGSFTCCCIASVGLAVGVHTLSSPCFAAALIPALCMPWAP